PAAAQVAPADEVDGEPQAVAEDRAEHVDVLRGRHAAEEHHGARRAGERGDGLGRRLERPAVATVLDVDVDARGGAKIGRRDRRIGREETRVRRDDEDTGLERGRRSGERARVRELAAKVEPAEKREDFAERSAGRRAQPFREWESRASGRQELGPQAATGGGREQEDPFVETITGRNSL